MAGASGPPPKFSAVLRRQRSIDDASERIQRRSVEFYERARKLAGRQQVQIEEVWPHIAWSCDVALHLLDDMGESSGKKTGIPHKFCVTAYTFVNFVQQRAHKGAEKLYEKYNELVRGYLQSDVVPAIMSAKGDDKIKEFIRRWENHKIFSEWIRRFFEILDRGFIADSVQASLSAVAVKEWKDTLFLKVKNSFIGTILATIKRHRDQGSMDEQSAKAIRSCKEIFCMMGITAHRDFKKIKFFVNHLKASRGKFEILEEFELLTQQHNRVDGAASADHKLKLGETKNLALYKQEFEKPIVDDTRTYCQGLRREWLASESLPSYLQKAQQVLDQESRRVDRYLHFSSKDVLLRVVEMELLKIPQQQGLLLHMEGSGFKHLLRNRAHEDLRLVFNMMKRVNDTFLGVDKNSGSAEDLKVGLKPLAKIFYEFIREEGFARITARSAHLCTLESQPKYTRRTDDPDYVSAVLKHFNETSEDFLNGDFNTIVKTTEGTNADARTIDKRVGQKWFKEQKDLAFEQIINWDFGKPGDKVEQIRQGRFKNKRASKTKGGERRTQMAELLAKYTHMVLMGKVRNNEDKIIANLSVTDIQDRCTQTLRLFEFLNNKDIFGDCYKAMLMKRLLGGNINNDNERSVLTDLGFQQGINYVRAMETMFADLQQSEQIQGEFMKIWNQKQSILKCCKDMNSLTVAVLTRTAWPPNLRAMDDLRLPDAMDQCKATFSFWYKDKNKRRELNFHWLQSQATLQAKFPRLNPKFNEIELKMTATQAMLLASFSREKLRNGHTMKEIAEFMGVEWNTVDNRPESKEKWEMLKNLLKSFLQPFPDCRGALIMKGPKRGPPILTTDKFKVNSKFQSKKRKLQIRTPDDWQRQFDGGERSMKSRKPAMEAAIVRVMKARSRLTHPDLIAEVTKQITTFKAIPKEINRCIGSLIDRDYLERDDENKRVYVYKA